MYKFVVVLVASVLLCDASPVKEPCSTPGVNDGLCVKLDDCPSISTMSNDFDTPMTIERLNYLIQSLCGYKNKTPMVCCPLEEITMLNLVVESTTAEENREKLTTTSSETSEETTNSNEIR